MNKFESQEYRHNLAEEIVSETDKSKRREILAKAKTTKEYSGAKQTKQEAVSDQTKEHIERLLKNRGIKRDAGGKLILYHATTAVNYAMIEKDQQIRPAAETGRRVYRLEGEGESAHDSHKKDKIYLADEKMVGGVASGIQESGGTVYTLEVHVDDDRLEPDEDTHQDKWYKSLGQVGYCSYKGNIKNYKIVDKKDFALSQHERLDFFEELSKTERESSEEKVVLEKWRAIKEQKRQEELEMIKEISEKE